MTPGLSVYLDILRFLAAMVVFLGHVSGHRLTGGFLWPLGGYMDDSVMAFFVLSGFVICHATHHSGQSIADYSVSRAARIYSVALPALAITFILDAIGRRVAPALYTSAWGYTTHDLIEQFAMNGLFVGQVWAVHLYPGSDLPYWSLGYEVWYYIIFGLAWYLPARRRWTALLAAVAAGPHIIALFPIWLLGAAIYRWRPHIDAQLGWALFIGSLVGVFFVARHLPLEARRYLVGLLFAANIMGARAVFALTSIRRPVRLLAGATFTLYLFHLPVAQFIRSVAHGLPAGGAMSRITVIVGTFSIVFALSFVTERQKKAWENALRASLGRVSERSEAVEAK